MEQKLQSKKDKIEDLCVNPTSRYYLKKQDEEIYDMIFVNNSSDIINIINDKDIKYYKTINLFYDKGNCFDLYCDLFKNNIEADVFIKNGNISFDMLKMNNIHNGQNITVYTHEDDGVTLHKEFGNNERI